MGGRSIAAGFAAGMVLGICTSASAKPAASYMLFKNGHAYCTAYGWTRPDGFVACSARIGGAWQSVVLQRRGRAFKAHQAAAPASRYQELRTHWRGGPFLCTVATDGVVCVSTVSGRGFGINGRGITTR
jgi:hypothetical protein